MDGDNIPRRRVPKASMPVHNGYRAAQYVALVITCFVLPFGVIKID